MSGFDPDDWQETVRSPQPDDETPVGVTYYQALKCAAIVDAFALGHIGYLEDARMVARFLQAAAAAAVHPGHLAMRPSLEETWEQIDRAPWPLPGPPRAQPDA